MGWKMVYNFLGIDEKTSRNLPTFDQNVRTVYSNIRTVYQSKNHVTTHPGYVTTTAMAKAILRLKTLALFLHRTWSVEERCPIGLH